VKIPFTNYELNITKRGITFEDAAGNQISGVDWLRGKSWISLEKSSPILNTIFETIASEFAKIDYQHIQRINKETDDFKVLHDDLDNCLNVRPNKLQTSFDFYFSL